MVDHDADQNFILMLNPSLLFNCYYFWEIGSVWLWEMYSFKQGSKNFFVLYIWSRNLDPDVLYY